MSPVMICMTFTMSHTQQSTDTPYVFNIKFRRTTALFMTLDQELPIPSKNSSQEFLLCQNLVQLQGSFVAPMLCQQPHKLLEKLPL